MKFVICSPSLGVLGGHEDPLQLSKLVSNGLKESIVIGQYVCNKAGGTSLYPNDPDKKAKIEELLEELKSGFDTLFIPLTRIFGVPEKTGDNEKYVSSMKKLAETRLTKV